MASPMIPLVPYPSSTDVRNVYGGGSTTITFYNRLPNDSARLYSIDIEGNRQLVTIIAPDASFSASSFVKQPWEVVVSYQGDTIKYVYYTEPDSFVVLDTSLFPIMV
ncbi:hypothetical protein C0991_002470 [Blastosporella zonata]|nr:hypothetical protein C0991_002470 [Blastosporella zonata]